MSENMYERAVKRFAAKAAEGKPLSRTTAVRMKCLDCMSFQVAEVTRCPSKDCPLYYFRMGKDESGKNASVCSKKVSEGTARKIRKEIGIRYQVKNKK